MTFTTVRLPVQDRGQLSVLYVRVPTDQIAARRFPVLDRTVRLSDRDRHSAAYESCPPVFVPLFMLTAWLDGMGWEWRQAERTDHVRRRPQTDRS